MTDKNKKIFSFLQENGDSYPTWEQRKLRDVLNLHSGKDQKGFEDPNGKYPILATGGEIGRTNVPLCSEESVLIGRKGTIDKPSYINTPFRTVDTLFYTTMKKGVAAKFIYAVVQSVKWKNLSEASGVPSLNSSIILNVDCPLPSLPEQKKIAEFFSALDERIALTADKVKLLKEQKQGYLQQVFARELVFTDENGERFPEWEEKRLGEVLDLCKNGTSETQNLDKKGYPVTRIETISAGKINFSKVGYVETESSLNNYLLKPEDILFSNINSIEHIGKTAIYTKDLPALYHGMNLLLLRANNETSGTYLFHYLNSEPARNYFRMIANKAVSQASINQTEVAKTVVPFPSLPEQEKIAEFFSALGEQIELNENKLELLKEQKKGYLQGIFG